MPLEYNLSDKLKGIVEKLRKKDARRADILHKKIKQVVQSDETTIEHYKNLRHDLSGLKRVHVNSSFVLTFRYDKARNFVLFLDFDHHDRIYKKT